MKQYTFLTFLLFFSFYSEAQKNYEPLKISDDLISIDGIIKQEEWDKALKIDVNYETQPKSTTKPYAKINEKDRYLKGFHWREKEQPKNKHDIFIE